MAHGAHPNAPVPAPRAVITLARDCRECRAWGTVVTPEGHHELCPACQYPDRTSPTAAPAPSADRPSGVTCKLRRGGSRAGEG